MPSAGGVHLVSRMCCDADIVLEVARCGKFRAVSGSRFEEGIMRWLRFQEECRKLRKNVGEQEIPKTQKNRRFDN